MDSSSKALIVIVIAIVAAICLTLMAINKRRRRLGLRELGQPRPLRGTMSPTTASLMTGRTHQGYIGYATAYTPDGTRVSVRTPRAYLSPDVAARKAQDIADSIERTGQ